MKGHYTQQSTTVDDRSPQGGDSFKPMLGSNPSNYRSAVAIGSSRQMPLTGQGSVDSGSPSKPRSIKKISMFPTNPMMQARAQSSMERINIEQFKAKQRRLLNQHQGLQLPVLNSHRSAKNKSQMDSI